MDLKVKKFNAEYINSNENYAITGLNKLVTILMYGQPGKRTHRAVAFKNTDMVRQVARDLLTYADFLDLSNDQPKI